MQATHNSYVTMRYISSTSFPNTPFECEGQAIDI